MELMILAQGDEHRNEVSLIQIIQFLHRAGQLTALDDAVKATKYRGSFHRTAMDTKGWGGLHYIVLGGTDVSDVRHATSMALSYSIKMQESGISVKVVIWSLAYSAAGQVLNKAFWSTNEGIRIYGQALCCQSDW